MFAHGRVVLKSARAASKPRATQVGSCAAAHKEVLDQCAECSQCPAAGGLCYQVKDASAIVPCKAW